MKFYKVRILKTGSNHCIDKKVCGENIDVAKEIVVNYLIKIFAEEQTCTQVEHLYHFRSTNNDEVKIVTNFSVPAINEKFEFKIDIFNDQRLEKFPEEIDVFDFINFAPIKR